MLPLVRRLVATAALAAVVSACPATADARTLEKLTITSFDLTADRKRAFVGQLVNVLIDFRASGSITHPENMNLPRLDGVNVRAAERSCGSSRANECTERLQISPTREGTLRIGPATLDALSTDGQVIHYTSNAIAIRVLPIPNASQYDPIAIKFVPVSQWLLVGTVAILVVLIVFLTLMFTLNRRRPAASPSQPQTLPPPSAPEPRMHTEFAALVLAFEQEPTRRLALAVRTELRAQIGSRGEETLADLIGRRAADEGVLATLSVLERAAFVEEG